MRTILLLLALAAVSCATPQEFYSPRTVGHVGCARQQIRISDASGEGGQPSWTASCPDRVYYCSGRAVGSDVVDVQCTPADATAEH